MKNQSFCLLLFFLMVTFFYGCKEDKRPAPTPSINFSFPCEVISGQQIQITNTTFGADKYSWDFGNSQLSNAQSPTVSYSSPGVFTIKLTASNNDNSANLSKQITVRSSPPLNKILPVQYYLQQTQSWCWAASTQMALSNNSVYVNQCSMVNYYIFGSTNGGIYDPYIGQYCNCCNYPNGYDTFGNYLGYSCIVGGYTFQIASDLKKYGNLYSETISRGLTFNEIQLEISQGRPIIIFYLPTSSKSQSGHYVVLFGYDSNGNLYINDPYFPSNPSFPSSPQHWIVPYSTTFSYNSGSLYWGTTIYKIGGSVCR